MQDLTSHRREFLRRLLLNGFQGNQADLIAAMKEQGIQAAQPSVSRDLRAIGAVKSGAGYILRETDHVTPLDSLRALLRDVNTAGPNLALIRCEPGAASAIARALEAEALDGMVGTVAGDDTVMVAVANKTAGRRVEKRILALLA